MCGAIKKSGQLSCCARGGAWFKNCGDVDDTNVDHTWAEGIEACRYSAGDASVESSLQTVLRPVEVTIYPLKSNQAQDDTQHQTKLPVADSMSIKSGCVECVGLAKAVKCICVLSILLHFRCIKNFCYVSK